MADAGKAVKQSSATARIERRLHIDALQVLLERGGPVTRSGIGPRAEIVPVAHRASRTRNEKAVAAPEFLREGSVRYFQRQYLRTVVTRKHIVAGHNRETVTRSRLDALGWPAVPWRQKLVGDRRMWSHVRADGR